jgi:DNA-binding PucR family transcriptional regulator
VYGLLDGYLVGVTGQPPPAADVLLVVGPAVPVAELPESFRLCAAARDAALRDGVGGLVRLTDLAVDTALDALPALGATLAEERLAALRPTVPFHRDLVATAVAHLNSGGRLDATAGALHVHPNTVKYRLRRMRELTGFGADPVRPGDAVRQTVHWWWALRTWQRHAASRS